MARKRYSAEQIIHMLLPTSLLISRSVISKPGSGVTNHWCATALLKFQSDFVCLFFSDRE